MNIADKEKDLSKYKGVWIIAETVRGKISPTAFELMHIGKKLAQDLGEPISVVMIGHNLSGFTHDFFSRGADSIYIAEDPKLANFVDEIYAKCLADMILTHKPNKVLLAATTMGRSLAAKTAILAETGLTADATSAVIDKETRLMHVTRPTFGGNLMATIKCAAARPEMCSLRPMSYPQEPQGGEKAGLIIKFPFDAEKYSSKVEFVGFVPEESGEIDIASAQTIVAGGRGMINAEGFTMLRDLAKQLDGAVGASRAAVDSGWIAYRHQVGLTGKTVKPKLYIACGISGQVQHMAGMSSSDAIVAINKDPECPMMKQATFSVEGDMFEVIPAIIEELKKQGN